MRILFTTNPLYGHLLSMLPLIRAAQAAGHEVAVASGDDFEPEVRRHGLDFWPVRPSMAEVREVLAAAEAAAEPVADERERLALHVTDLFGRPGAARARELRPLVAHWRPGIVVGELTDTSAAEAAYVSGALLVVHGFGTHMPAVGDLAGLLYAVAAAELGGPNRWPRVQQAPYVDPCPPLLQSPDGSLFPHQLRLRPDAGAVYASDRLPESMRRLPYERSIYLTLGTVFNDSAALQTALDAVRDLPVNVLVTVGPEADPAAYGPMPEHVVLEPFVPQGLLLPRVEAVVSHAGSGTMLGAVAHGLPQVCLPIGADQFSNAARVAASDAGIVVDPDVRTPETIRAAIEQVLAEPSYAAAARRVQADLAAMPSADEVLEVLVAEAEREESA